MPMQHERDREAALEANGETPDATEETDAATWEGGHALVVQYGDAEFFGRCQCGTPFGYIRPDQSLDRFADKWERHAMASAANRG